MRNELGILTKGAMAFVSQDQLVLQIVAGGFILVTLPLYSKSCSRSDELNDYHKLVVAVINSILLLIFGILYSKVFAAMLAAFLLRVGV
ncbi:hypothetical protein [Enterococcus alishanensis]